MQSAEHDKMFLRRPRMVRHGVFHWDRRLSRLVRFRASRAGGVPAHTKGKVSDKHPVLVCAVRNVGVGLDGGVVDRCGHLGWGGWGDVCDFVVGGSDRYRLAAGLLS